MLKLCTVLIGVQSALVRRDDHRSELQQQEEKKASPVVQPASTPGGNLVLSLSPPPQPPPLHNSIRCYLKAEKARVFFMKSVSSFSSIFGERKRNGPFEL